MRSHAANALRLNWTWFTITMKYALHVRVRAQSYNAVRVIILLLHYYDHDTHQTHITCEWAHIQIAPVHCPVPRRRSRLRLQRALWTIICSLQLYVADPPVIRKREKNEDENNNIYTHTHTIYARKQLRKTAAYLSRDTNTGAAFRIDRLRV